MDRSNSLDFLIDFCNLLSPRQIKELTLVFKLAAKRPDSFGLVCHCQGKVQYFCDHAPRLLGMTPAELMHLDYKESAQVKIYTIWLCDQCGVDVVVGKKNR